MNGQSAAQAVIRYDQMEAMCNSLEWIELNQINHRARTDWPSRNNETSLLNVGCDNCKAGALETK